MDRLIAVYDPFNYKVNITPKRTMCVIACIWVYTFIISFLPALFGFHQWHPQTECFLAKIIDCYAVYNLLANFYFAAVVIFFAYAALFRIAARHMKQMAAMEIADATSNKLKRHLKASKTLLIVIGTFSVCWLPFTFNLINMLVTNPNDPFSVAKKVQDFLSMCLIINSGVNPVIYARMLPGFRSEFIRILSCYKYKGNNVLPQTVNGDGV